jgi:PAS domain S-box-containing protein
MKPTVDIFIVEDEFLVAESIKADLKRFNYNVVGKAASGEEALQKIAETKPDLILMDINLKGKMTGIDVSNELKKTLNIPVVFLSAHADENTLNQAKEVGAFGFLVKPFQAIDLISTIEVTLAKSHTLKSIKTEQERSVVALEESEKRYQQIIENVSDLIYTTDKKGIIRYANPSALKVTEFSHEEITGQSYVDFIREDYKKMTLNFYRNALLKKLQNTYFEFPIITKSEKEVWLGQNVTLIKDDNNSTIQGFQAMARDITERIKFEKELIESKEQAISAAKIKSQFITNMSHEIRTPLNGIIGISNLLQKTELDDKQKKYLQAIVTSADQLMGIINNILDLSKIEAKRMTFDEKPFDLHDLISGLETLFETRARQKNLSFLCRLDNQIPKIISGDSIKLNQILFNLVGNSLKFTDEGFVQLDVKLKERSDKKCIIQFKVIDTGIGIDQKHQEKIFSAFSQVESDTSRRYGGTGLGLTIVKKLVELQNGSIDLFSSLGKGTTFIVELTFSITSDDLMNNDKNKEDQEQYNFENLKILLAEDNLVNQLVTSDLLKAQHAEVTIAVNGQEAIDLLRLGNFDMILMDMQMPHMDGYQAMKIIRSEFSVSKRNIPITALTAHAFEGELNKCLEFGANFYLSKPFRPVQLFEVINKMNELNDEESFSDDFSGINDERLLPFFNNNEELMISTLELIVDSVKEDLHKMTEHYQNKQYEPIQKIAHKIKPNFELLGLMKIHQECLKLEKSSDPLKIDLHLKRLSKGMDNAFVEIDQLIKKHFNHEY